MKTALTAITVGFSLIVGVNCGEAATVNLYSGSGAPASQPWLTFTNVNLTSFPPVAIETPGAGAVNLNTNPSDSNSSNPIYAGYSNYNLIGNLKNAAFPTLERATGYTLNFALQNNSEFHDGANGPDRAGFSVIALSNDLQGIELGFWTDEIWAQNVGFTKGESNQFDTQSSLNSYALTVTGNTYTLSANGTPLTNLTNQPLRDYSAFGAPYNTPNLIFLGDDTTSARANINLGAVSVTTAAAAVPFNFSPTLGLLSLGSLIAVSQLKNQKKRQLL